MKIGIRASPRSSGGGQVFVNNLAHALNDAPGCSGVTLFAMGEGSAFEVPDQVEVRVPHNPALRQILGDAALARAVRIRHVDVMIAPGTEVSLVPGVASVMWPLTVAPFEDAAMRQLGRSIKSNVRWRLLRHSIERAVGRSSGLVFSSHYARALYHDHIPSARNLLSHVIAPAASLSADAPDVAYPGLPDKFVLFVSHLYPYKMAVETIQAFALARDRGVKHHLVMAGDMTHAEYAERIRATINSLGLRDVVHLLGSVSSELPHLYRRADLFVFPSISENAGSYALIDAFAFGTPVLSSSMSSMPEACQGAVRYFDPRDPEQLADELVCVLNNPTALSNLAGSSAQRGMEYRDWVGVADELLQFAVRVRRGAGDA